MRCISVLLLLAACEQDRPAPPAPPPAPSPDPVVLASSEVPAFAVMAVAGADVYWTEMSAEGRHDNTLWHQRGTAPPTKRTVASWAIAADATYVYYIGDNGHAFRQPHGATDGEDIAPLAYPIWLALDGDTLFAVDSGTILDKPHARLWKAAPGAKPVALVDANAIAGLSIVGHRLYFARDNAVIESVDEAGKDEQILDPHPARVYVDAKVAYLGWTDGLARVRLPGGVPEPLLQGTPIFPAGGDAKYVYAWVGDNAVAIDKATLAQTTLAPGGLLQAIVGTDGLYLNQGKRIVRVPQPR
ncbi:MAG TPA: hypothetical protein VGM88_22185 [Kofleriaceae bacterium]|jgi:hypothetical protein